MKLTKILSTVFVVTLIASSLIFTGCGEEELEEPISRDYETLTGEFMTLGSIKVDKTVTHLFESDEGEIYYSYSERYDLDDPDYLGQRVEAYGVVMEFESLDKNLFEVRRITEADEEDEEEADATDREYKDTELGVSFTYPDNWALTALRDSLHLEAPGTEDEDGNVLDPDYMIIANLGEVLEKTSQDSNDDRAAEISTYVEANYEGLEGVASQMSYVGTDKVFGVKYKTDSGDISYFVPRGAELFELGFYHPIEEDGEKLSNGNIFSGIISTFRFLPYGDEDATQEEDANEEALEGTPEEETPMEEPAPAKEPAEQMSYEDYHHFESAPYGFKISYPDQWYYSGGNGGYDFADEPLDDGVSPLVRLDFNARSAEGNKSGEVTVKVGDRFYTLTGSSEYQDIMETMASSIVSTE